MKSERIVKTELKALRGLIDSTDTDNLTKRVAYEIECAIRWAREDVTDWPDRVYAAANCARLIREEVKRGDIKL